MQANTNLYQTQISKKISHGSVKTIESFALFYMYKALAENKTYAKPIKRWRY